MWPHSLWNPGISLSPAHSGAQLQWQQFPCNFWPTRSDHIALQGFWYSPHTFIFELWCWRTVLGPLDCQMIKPVNPKGNQSWIFIGRTDAEAEAPILWPPDVKSWLIGKDSDAGKDWRQEEKGMAEVKMVERHRWLNGHKFEQALGDG